MAATGIGFPMVPKGRARVRTIVPATHTMAELDQSLDVFRKVGKKLGISGVAGQASGRLAPISTRSAVMSWLATNSRELFAEGVLSTGIGFPTVPKERARVRTIVTPTHTKAELDQALDVFRKVGKKLGILA